ncbi:predicted protein [Histoplasma capsulatum G186AR]|uniref:Uncharacterized protein n=1 Tax=Ajellomyces capsulatus (strain G186AR / H82 / ATCC MYA-2454 / RMSCC 2432) TaxID=447093 RepID=C0NZ75_AJECG|nr:uncharacterized protein HCBG_08455 [Histoplasma capsulatum G186AR]EEH03514.1 predicted protein [Histoplasma capsulatum G186AR]
MKRGTKQADIENKETKQGGEKKAEPPGQSTTPVLYKSSAWRALALVAGAGPWAGLLMSSPTKMQSVGCGLVTGDCVATVNCVDGVNSVETWNPNKPEVLGRGPKF